MPEFCKNSKKLSAANWAGFGKEAYISVSSIVTGKVPFRFIILLAGSNVA